MDAGSFVAAADLLGKSAVSRRVAELEARLAVRLLQRTSRRLSLTVMKAAASMPALIHFLMLAFAPRAGSGFGTPPLLRRGGAVRDEAHNL